MLIRNLATLRYLDDMNLLLARAESVARRDATADFTDEDLAWFRHSLAG